MPKKIFVFDLDGTLSDSSHRLHLITTPGKKKDWKTFFERLIDDPPFEAMLSLVHSLNEQYDNTIVFQTGRPEKYRKLTGEWFKKNSSDILFDVLLMRQNSDFCDNVTLKLRFLEWIMDTYDVGSNDQILWFEDSERVVKALNAQQSVLCLSAQHFPGASIPSDHKEIPEKE